MKNVRLAIPLNVTRRIFIKIEGQTANAYYDKECKQSILKDGPEKFLKIEIPDNVEVIAVATPCVENVCEDISNAWFAMSHVFGRIENLKQIRIITEGGFQTTISCEEIPYIKGWIKAWEENCKKTWWKTSSWGLVVYYYETAETSAILRWNSKAAQ